MTEEWCPVRGFPDYLVSDLGRVRRADDEYRRILRPQLTRGYHYVSVFRRDANGKSEGKRLRLHRIVWEAHVGEAPRDLFQIDHIDGDKLNNRIGNLQMVSPQLHVKLAYLRRQRKGKLNVEDVSVIRARIASGDKQTDIARDYGVSKNAICHLNKGRSWGFVKND